MRLYLALMTAGLLAGCTKTYGPQRLDFVNTTRFTSSNRTGLNPADTLASRLYAENNDASGPKLGRLLVTVQYRPKRDPFLYPTPVSSINRDLIDKNPEDFVFLDSALVKTVSGQNVYPDNFLLTTTYGVRTTTGSEHWQYELRNSNNDVTASRAVDLGMRRIDSLAVYHDYLLKLVIPAVGVDATPEIRSKSARRFLSLYAGLALPAYTVLRAGAPGDAQNAAQQVVDLIILPDGLTLVSPDSPTLSSGSTPALNSTRWPNTAANRRATLIYPAPNITTATFTSQLTAAAIQAAYTTAAGSAGSATGKLVGPVGANQVYAFRTDEGAGAATRYRYGLLLVVSVPTSSTTATTAGLQLQVRMAKG